MILSFSVNCESFTNYSRCRSEVAPHIHVGEMFFFSARGLRHRFFWRFFFRFFIFEVREKMGKGRVLAMEKGWHPFSVGVFSMHFRCADLSDRRQVRQGCKVHQVQVNPNQLNSMPRNYQYKQISSWMNTSTQWCCAILVFQISSSFLDPHNTWSLHPSLHLFHPNSTGRPNAWDHQHVLPSLLKLVVRCWPCFWEQPIVKGMVIYGDKVKGLIHVTMLLGALVS